MDKWLEPLFRRLCRSSYRHPFLWLLLFALLGVPAFFQVQHLSIDTNLTRLLPKHSPAAEWTRKLEKVVSDGGYFTVFLESDDPLRLNQAVEETVARISKIPGVRTVEYRYPLDFIEKYRYMLIPSSYLTKVSDEITRMEAEANPFGVDLLSESGPDSKKGGESYGEKEDRREMEKLLHEYGSMPPFHQSPDGKIRGMIVRPYKGVSRLGETTKLFQTLEKIASQVGQKYNLWTGVAGSLRNKVNEFNLILSDLNLSGTISTTLIILFLFISFRSLKVVPILLLPVGVGLLYSYALVPTLVGSLNTITSFLLLVIFGLGVENPIHLVKRFQAELVALPTDKALEETFVSTGSSVVISGLTTAVPLFILDVSNFRGFSEFGIIAGVAILLMMVTLLTLMPSVMVLGHRFKLIKGQPERVGRSFLPSPKVSAFVGFLVLIALVGTVFALRFDYDFSNLKATLPDSESVGERHRKVYTASMSPAALYVAPDQKSLDEMLKVLEQSKSRPGSEIGRVTSLRDYAPSATEAALRKEKILELQDQLQGGWVKKVKDPEKRRWAEDLQNWKMVEPATLQDLPSILSEKLVAQDDSGEYLLGIYPNKERKNGKNAMAFTQELYGLKLPAGVKGPVGETPLFAEILWIVTSEGPWLIFFTVLGVIALILLHSRSLQVTLLIVFPLLSGVIMTLGVMTLFGLKLNFFNVIVIPTLLGMGVDFGVHYYRRWHEMNKDLSAVQHELFEPLTTVTITQMLGYSGMVFARHPGLESIGIAACIGLMGNLVGYLTLLPGMIRWVDKRFPGKLKNF